MKRTYIDSQQNEWDIVIISKYSDREITARLIKEVQDELPNLFQPRQRRKLIDIQHIPAHAGRKHTDKELKHVAQLYEIAYRNRIPVQQFIANAFKISPSTAAKRIMAARKHGFITIK